MFRRKIENTMLSWKQSNNRKPLVIKGCRQCGKTSSVLEFARKLGDYNVGMKELEKEMNDYFMNH